MRRDLPPEAYTKETLQKAFDWLQEQPEPVKASIHTPERLVSLFQKSQRLNDKDAPVSSKKFITDLKNLATSLDQFNGDKPPQILEPQSFVPKPKPKEVVKAPEKLPLPTVKAEDLGLDPQSLEKLEKVRSRFNLSSQNEALRLIISLGFEKFSDIQ